MVDGSATRDPDGDALTYAWTLKAAPPGSGIAVAATTPTFAFRPDIPGEYELQLTVSDGARSSTDTARVMAEALFRVRPPGKFTIDAASAAGSDVINVTLRTSGHFKGTPATFSVASSAPWLTVPPAGTLATAGADTPIPLRLVPGELRRMENGTHQARVTITPNGGWSGGAADITLDLALPIVRVVTPYVAYVGEPSRVTLSGENLQKADGKSLFIGGAEALGIEATSDTEAAIDLPPLAAGTYTVRIANALGVDREMARVVVRAAPVYRDMDDIPVGGPIQSFAYDAERDAIYFVMRARTGEFFGLVLRNDGTGGWSTHALPVSPPNFEPLSLAISPDGTHLWMTSLHCVVHRVHLDTLAIVESTQKQPCEPDSGLEFTDIAPLADGRILIVERTLDPIANVLEYPGFTRTDVLPPRGREPLIVLNDARNRLLYVQPGARNGDDTDVPALVDVYDIHGTARPVELQDFRADVRGGNLTMTANGSKTLHAVTLYDRQFKPLGRLATDTAWTRVGSTINARGTRAAALDHSTDALTVHDVTGRDSFPQLGAAMVLPGDVGAASRLHIPQSGGAVFAIALIISGDASFYNFFVRTHPALTR
jgi:hypothetical protein